MAASNSNPGEGDALYPTTMGNDDSGNRVVFRRPPLERQGRDRNLEVINREPRRLSLRNKVKYEESVQRIQEIQRRLEQTSEHTPSNCAAHAELLEQTREIVRLLSSSIQETNVQNENTIRNLQSELVEVTRERDAAVKDTERLEKIAAKSFTAWEGKLQQERKGFAAAMHKQKKKAEELKRMVNKYGRRCREMECELNERGGRIELGEDRGARGKVQSTATDTGAPNTVVIHDEVRARAEKLPNWTKERSNDASDMNERMKSFAQHHEVSVKDRVNKYEKRCMKERGGAMEFGEERRARGKVRSAATDTGIPNTIVIYGEVRACAEKLPNWAEEQSNDESGEQRTATTVTDSSNGVKDYEEKLETVNGELNQLSATIYSLKEMRKVLGAALKESNETEEY